jgi:hypothetical protein
MANIKFSAFTTETDDTQIDFLAGYQGTTMKKIAPANLSGSYPFLIETDSLYSGFVPSGLSGTPQGNTVLGIDAGNALTVGTNNTIIGNDAGKIITNGGSNVFIGFEAALNSSTNTSDMVVIGQKAFENGSGGSNSVLIGKQAGTNQTGEGVVGIGREAGRVNTADYHVSIGYQAGYSQTSGVGNTHVGFEAGYTATTGGDNSFFGYQAGKYVTGNDNTAIGREAMEGTAVATNEYFNVAVGYGSLTNCAGAFQCATLGHSAGNSITSGSNLTVLGYNAQPSSATATNEITLGNASAALLRIPGLGSTDGHVLTYETASGGIVLKAAGGGGGGATSLNGLSDVLIDGTSNYFVNIPAGLSGNPVDNLVIGDTAGNALTTGFSNVLLGHDAGLALTTGEANINIGTEAGKTNSTDDGQINIGFEAGSLSTKGYHVHIGYNAAKNGDPLSSSSSNVAIGKNAMLGVAATTNTYASVAIGEDALKDITTGDRIIGIGKDAGQSHTSNGDAIYIGYNAGGNLNASQTVIIGNGAVDTLVGAWNQHTVVGKDACAATSSGSGQVAFGYQALISQTSGNKNSAFGFECLESLTTGGDNAAFGYEAGDKVTGAQNTLFGSQAGSSGTDDLTSGDNNTLIGYNAQASAATVSNEITLGNSSIATLRCQVTSITALSDKRDKENIQPSTYGLDLVNKLKPVTFDWNTRDGAKVGVKDLGFIAQDLQEIDNENLKLVYDNNPEKLEASYGRLVPVLVKAIQELKAEIELLKSK